MACLHTYSWVKFYRDYIPDGEGVLKNLIKLATRVAFRSGFVNYCNHHNSVQAGEWVGGIVGLKSILEAPTKTKAIQILDELQQFGYVEYFVEKKTYHLSVSKINWYNSALKTNRAACATGGYGFICVPRNIGDALTVAGYKFSEADALIDLWCHTVYAEKNNIFSLFAPSVRYGNEIIITLDYLGKRWGWEKTKVSRFFKKYSTDFRLIKMAGSFGSLIYNENFPVKEKSKIPEDIDVTKVTKMLLDLGEKEKRSKCDHDRMNKIIIKYSFVVFNEILEVLSNKTENSCSEEKNVESSDEKSVKENNLKTNCRSTGKILGNTVYCTNTDKNAAIKIRSDYCQIIKNVFGYLESSLFELKSGCYGILSTGLSPAYKPFRIIDSLDCVSEKDLRDDRTLILLRRYSFEYEIINRKKLTSEIINYFENYFDDVTSLIAGKTHYTYE